MRGLCVLRRLLLGLCSWGGYSGTCNTELLILAELSAVAIALGCAVTALALKCPMGMILFRYDCGESQPLQFFLETDIFFW